MIYSETGIIAKKHLLEIPIHMPVVSLDSFVVMPNHIHCIITITDRGPVKPVQNQTMARISPKPGSLSTAIRSYKSSVTKWCNENKISFAWQTRFHDHIIRNEKDYERIRR